ncbi:hypothetical protein ASE85_06940 [Sphingobium sp. Leaf26]|uniref:calcium-binding protein n=1 Tax=Sphingobium sp. Leaf26 TaxID=1735693 RepID=UPI000701CE21|nr:hypothetical protein [Sphingobium sp. Leaf26]KQN04727.1 hypothetical protein ASE85_06940 [Sphingobium sp. Leaf26]
MANFSGTSGNDIFTGGDEDDVATGGLGNDRLTGGEGSDILSGDEGADTLNGGGGDDYLFSAGRYYDFSFSGIYYLNKPVLDTGAEADTVLGGNGDDVIFAGYNDVIDGGAGGEDTLYFSLMGATHGVTMDFRLPVIANGTGSISGIENIGWVQGSNYGDTLILDQQGSYGPFGVVYAMGGDDHVVASYYTDHIYGGGGNDILDGRPSGYLDILDGGDGNDTLYSNDGSGEAYGGNGDDTIYAGGLVRGGAGNDRIVMQSSYYHSGVFGDEGNDEIRTSREGNVVSGGSGADRLIGDAGSDTLIAGDYLPGPYYVGSHDMGTERDVLSGDGGDDILWAGWGDSVDGGSGTDRLYYSLGGATAGVALSTGIFASASPQALGGGTVQNVERLVELMGSAFADRITVATQDSLLTIHAGAGDDVVTTGDSSVTLNGGDGNDRLVSGAAADSFDGGAGVDTIDYDAYASGVSVNLLVGKGAGGDSLRNVENIVGSAFADTLVGDGSANLITAGAGNDSLDGGAGADRLVGGLGNDTYYVDNVGDVVVEQAGEGYDVVITNIDYTLGANVEGIKLLNLTKGVEVHGNGLNNSVNAAYASAPLAAGTQIRMFGEGGDDTLLGSRHDDYLDGGTGVDTMTGGLGNDSYVVDDARDVVVEQAGQGYDVVITSIDYTLGANVEGIKLLNVTRGVEVHGNSLNNSFNAAYVGASLAAGTQIRMFGEGGNDTLLGSRHGDYLDGGAGIDTMTGGFGNDTYVVDNKGDVVVEQAGQGYDVVITNIDYTLGANVEGIKLLNLTRGVEVHGNGLNNSLNAAYANGPLAAGTKIQMFGEGGNDTLLGSRNDDYLDGGTGVDTMTGGFGNDTYVVDNAGDIVVEQGGQGYDVVVTSIDYMLGANVEGLKLLNLTKGVEAHGNGLNNSLNAAYVNTPLAAGTTIRLFGEGGSDSLLGSRYGDFLDGGAGNDTLQGGGGNDRFHFGDGLHALSNVDTILDFQLGDMIELDDAVFNGLSTGALGAGAFVANAAGAATSAEQRIVYDTDSGQLFFDADGSGAGGAVLFAVLNGHPAIGAADFVVV